MFWRQDILTLANLLDEYELNSWLQKTHHMFIVDNIVKFLFILFVINLCVIFLLRFVAVKVNLLDYPGGRKSHSSPTPLIGGLAIYVTLLASFGINNDWQSNFSMIALWAAPVFFIGLIDDFRQIWWVIRLIVQVFASIGVILSTGIEINYLGSYPIIGALELGALSVVFTVFAVVGLTNAYNLVDGINGLCGGLLLVPIVALALMNGSQVYAGEHNLLVIISSLLVFLFFNLINHPKSNLFLGDAGSAGLGFIVSFVIISQIQDSKFSANPPLALWLVIVPIVDTVSVIVMRGFNGQSIFQPSSDHLHHRLVKIGFSPNNTFLILCCLAFLGVIIGAVLNAGSDLLSVCIFFLALVFFPLSLSTKEKRDSDW